MPTPSTSTWQTIHGSWYNMYYFKTYFKVVSQARPIAMPKFLSSNPPSPASWEYLLHPSGFRSPKPCPGPIFIPWLDLLGQGRVGSEAESRAPGWCLSSRTQNGTDLVRLLSDLDLSISPRPLTSLTQHIQVKHLPKRCCPSILDFYICPKQNVVKRIVNLTHWIVIPQQENTAGLHGFTDAVINQIFI